ncbi:MAG: MFS transporter, partial [Chloroflexota bacterium]
IIASGIGVTPVVFGRLLSVRSAAGLLTPVFGNLAERRGYRVTLPTILFCGAIGAFLFANGRSPIVVLPAIFIMGIGITTFQPMLVAYSSEAIPQKYRARGMGIIEYGWALASIVGVFTVGRLLEVSGWQLPLMILGAGLGLMGVVFWLILRKQPDLDDSPPISLKEQFTITENRAAAFAGIAIQALIVFSGLHFFISYSIWLVNDYQFDALQLASVVLAFGFVDLMGSGLVSALLDRLGRQRGIILGGSLAGLLFLLMGPLATIGLTVALGLLLVGRFLFEFSIVTGLIIVSEQSPSQRSRVMSITGFVTTFSQAAAGLTGPLAVELFGLNGLTVPSAVGFLISAVLGWLFIKNQ